MSALVLILVSDTRYALKFVSGMFTICDLKKQANMKLKKKNNFDFILSNLCFNYYKFMIFNDKFLKFEKNR
ncbi:hypothetical protein GCM10010992_02440 [Cloacibacterium rupense]|uniref:Uncharacterized protein n=1 Tax=Cloacibacterium rupense TaxID=517423 RepID=A0ABQ2NKK8_9FLAO|nr:hypothetical protein GCM10010992_02440 [Cloacibacterium rupense]